MAVAAVANFWERSSAPSQALAGSEPRRMSARLPVTLHASDHFGAYVCLQEGGTKGPASTRQGLEGEL